MPLAPRTKGCASGAGALGAVEPGEFRRLPSWLKIQLPGKGEYAETKAMLREQRMVTVCEEARCPNLGHCWARGTATIMILGELCTRRCGFCAVAPGKPNGYVDWDEPRRVGESVAAHEPAPHRDHVGLPRRPQGRRQHDLRADVIAEIRKRSKTVIEVLIPDFRGSMEDLQRVIDARPEVINHNVETVERLHPVVRPSARYDRSLQVLQRVQGQRHGHQGEERHHGGPGRDRRRGRATLGDLRAHGCDLLTIGQYLRPSSFHLPVVEYVHPDQFAEYARIADRTGLRERRQRPAGALELPRRPARGHGQAGRGQPRRLTHLPRTKRPARVRPGRPFACRGGGHSFVSSHFFQACSLNGRPRKSETSCAAGLLPPGARTVSR